ncbi:MAG: metallophosphoesterase [Sedimentisphaerales bacterium]|nr:metallophosphoesterase [Sedimentisphaerales bacterium]
MHKVKERPPRHKKLITHGLYLKRAALGTLGFCTRSAVAIEGLAPQWLEIVEIDLNLTKIHHNLHGTRIAHVSDLHLSRTVGQGYLQRCIERLNRLEADIVVLTGDYITYDIRGKYREQVAALLGRIKSRFGTYACLGNHDYGIKVQPRRRRDYMLIRFLRNLRANGITVLRNQSRALNIHGELLRLVGLGDLKVDDFHPQEAFADIPDDQAKIALVHNPRAVEYIEPFGVDVVFSGHTHGQTSRFPPEHMLNLKGRQFHAGMYDVNGTRLYVNRGLGRVGRIRFNSRPEITVLTLR